jgi:hypothetical protein
LSCNLSALNANARHIVTDGRDDVVLVSEENATTFVDIVGGERGGKPQQ